ncbi:MAG: cupin domain-containing protein, partial [Acidimicrobiia bacterium]|nr:cupin domain-containing protein [Acidimicrobiia bacterium]
MPDSLVPFNFQEWIDEHRHLLRPPVGAKQVFDASEDYVIIVVGGPNDRPDFHINQTEEFFFQLEGDMVLKVRQDDEIRDIPIRQGDVMLLPANTIHSPRRPAGTV